jgi:signal transduction histidine kinase
MADPARLAGRAAPVLVHVEGISVDADANPRERREEAAIPPRTQRITVTFTGLSLSVPERIMFRYRLDGFDRDWSEPTSLRQAVYTNLGPGTYKFHVIASNSDGVWNPSGSTMRFTIAPALWQTSWARLSAFLLLTAMGWTVYRVRLGQVARQLNIRFEERLAERTRIAQELHDTLLQGFVSASMQLHVAAGRLPADSSAKSSLGRVVELMGRVIEEGRNAVRSLRSSSSESLDLKQAFSGVADEFGSDGQPAYRVIVEGRLRPLNPMIRDDVYRIGREALVNAFRHSNAKAIEIELRYGSSELRMLVRDNGCGIDSQIQKSGREGHWGLPGMRERAERIGARFKVWSSASAGTEIELSVPGLVAFARERSDGQR